jgi:hypothetical protein
MPVVAPLTAAVYWVSLISMAQVPLPIGIPAIVAE